MKVCPVSRYADPRFPTRASLDAHPELLRLTPERWRRNRIVLAVLAGAGLLAAGFQHEVRAEGGVRVAPIFQHGEGRGSFGCVAVNPPVFLSEDEARQVIAEEMKKVGITFTADSLTLKGVEGPVTSQWDFLEENKGKTAPKTQQMDLKLDGTNAKWKISYEFVSQDDFKAWEKPTGSFATASEFNVIGAAKTLQRGLQGANEAGTVGVFYDPMKPYRQITEKDILKPGDYSLTTLAPVSAFAAWGQKSLEEKGNIVVLALDERHTITFVVGSAHAMLNAKPLKLPCAVVRYRGVPYVPAFTVAKALGIPLDWDAKKSRATLRMPGKDYELTSTPLSVKADGLSRSVSVIFHETDYQGQMNAAKAMSREELRKQVRDFIQWLKAEDVI